MKGHVENQSALEKLLEDLKNKIDNQKATPEVWLSIFMLQFANMEDYLKLIVKMVLIDITKKQNLILHIEEFPELTFGQAINTFDDLFLKGKYTFRGSNKVQLELSLNLQKAGSIENKTSFLFSIPYLGKYVSRLRWFNTFRNNLYHNLFSFNRGKNINQIIQMIQEIIDLEFLPDGTYNS
ncbi:hypothetical protein CANDROIZ_490008 [Candidatus Roizmanbacteria bacterium]|nr:hypothetical protein CANDROIZ_490008 [Candidatus Roizmanbacteria bacterium]